jgi:hypothetical protein
MQLVVAVAVVQALTGCVAPNAGARVEVSVGVRIGAVNDFYEPLAEHGYWVDIAHHGRCWRPSYVASDWRPYCDGYWTWTDDGWFWVSYEPFGWAAYHYGRWTYDSYHGWVWVPDTVWGPSWVSWREGGDYIGWAPLSPGCDFGPDGFILGARVVIEPRWFVYVQHRRFCEPVHRRTVIINNTTIINQTVNITKIRRVNNTVINDGPNVELVRRSTGQKFHPTPVRDIWAGKVPPPAARPTAAVKMETPAQVPPAHWGKKSSEVRNNEPKGHGVVPRTNEPKKSEPVITAPPTKPVPPVRSKQPDVFRGTERAVPPMPKVEAPPVKSPPAEKRGERRAPVKPVVTAPPAIESKPGIRREQQAPEKQSPPVVTAPVKRTPPAIESKPVPEMRREQRPTEKQVPPQPTVVTAPVKRPPPTVESKPAPREHERERSSAAPSAGDNRGFFPAGHGHSKPPAITPSPSAPPSRESPGQTRKSEERGVAGSGTLTPSEGYPPDQRRKYRQ